MIFYVVVAVVSILAGGIASIAGFGIGSLLTPTLGLRYGVKLAVAAVSIPHFIGTVVRFMSIRHYVDRRVFVNFGLMSAVGGLVGALLHTVLESPILSTMLGALLVFAGITGITGLSDNLRFGGRVGWLAGALSGLLGGLVGNQGGIRSAALLGFDLPRQAFVATATAIALVIDIVRMPVYFITEWDDIVGIWPVVAIATVGILIGTIAGRRILEYIPELVFRRVVSAIILALGIALLFGLGS